MKSIPDLKKLSDEQLQNALLELEKLTPVAKFHENPISEHFTEACFISSDTGLPIILPPHQLEWHKFIRNCIANNKRKILILSPRGHGKSVNLISLLLYFLWENQNHRIRIISASDQIALKRQQVIQDIITKKDEFRILTQNRVEPDLQRGWGQDTGLFVKRNADLLDPSVSSIGINGNLLGTRSSILLLDDVVTQQNSENIEQREKLLNNINTSILPTLEPDGIVLAIGTIFRLDDLYSSWMDSGNWSVLCQSIDKELNCIQQVTW